MNHERSGFTLVELIIVTVLGALLIAASLQILITNNRTYTAQTAEIQGQQSTRAAVDILFNELREISAQGGDLISIGTHALQVRTMRKFAVTCSVSSASPPVLTALQVGDWFSSGDSVFVFADNSTSIATDDDWIAAKVTAVDTTKTCGSSKAQALSFSGQAALFTADSVRTGAPIRSYVYYTYGLVTQDGETYLGRKDSGGTEVPLVGPLKATTGVEFAYLDSDGNATATKTNVRQIRVTIRTDSQALNSVGEPVSDSITAVVYTRN